MYARSGGRILARFATTRSGRIEMHASSRPRRERSRGTHLILLVLQASPLLWSEGNRNYTTPEKLHWALTLAVEDAAMSATVVQTRGTLRVVVYLPSIHLTYFDNAQTSLALVSVEAWR